MEAATRGAEEALEIAANGKTTNNRSSSNYYVQSPSAGSSPVSLSHGHDIEPDSESDSEHQLVLLMPPSSSYHSHHHNIHHPQPAAQQHHQEEEEAEDGDDDLHGMNTIINNQQHNYHRHHQYLTTTRTTTTTKATLPITTLSSKAAFHLSPCSSSRSRANSAGSSTLPLLHHQQNSIIQNNNILKKLGKSDDDGDINAKDEDEDEDDGYKLGGGSGRWWTYLSFRTYPESSLWIVLQLTWRLSLSFIAALLVFYLATIPPPPHLKVEVGEVKQFELAEGVDSSGVSTNFLSCNISMALVIDNKSQVFGLSVLSPLLVDIYFGRLPLVFSQEAEMMNNEKKKKEEEAMNIMTRIRAQERKGIKVSTGTRGKAMYGAGRNMEDMLKSGQGLPLFVSLSFSSYYDYRLIRWLIRPTFHHHAHCLLFLVNFGHHSNYNSTCSLLSS